jgi:hypothetical protein
MQKRAVLLFATAGLFLLSGCVDLNQVTALHDDANAARAALPRISDDFYASCQRRAAILARIPLDQLPQNQRPPTDCVPFKNLATHLAADQNVLVDYLDALSKLASGQTLNYAKTIDTNVGTINGLTAASGANADVSADAQKAGVAALSITKELANLATGHYREKEVQQLLIKTDPAVQQLTTALKTVVVTDYGIMLDSEKTYIDAYYQGPMAADGQKEPLSLILVQHQYDLDLAEIQKHRDAAEAYGDVMTKIATLHAKLTEAAKQPSGFENAVKNHTLDFEDLKDAITHLLAEAN